MFKHEQFQICETNTGTDTTDDDELYSKYFQLRLSTKTNSMVCNYKILFQPFHNRFLLPEKAHWFHYNKASYSCTHFVRLPIQFFLYWNKAVWFQKFYPKYSTIFHCIKMAVITLIKV